MKKALSLMVLLAMFVTMFPFAVMAEEDVVIVRAWLTPFENWDQEWTTKWFDEFNATHTDIQVEMELVPDGAWDEKLKSAQAAGTAPDIINNSYGNVVTYAQAGTILPLDDYTDPAIWEDLYDNVEEFITYDGKHYAYPKLVEPSIALFYRKDLFEAAGLDPETPPTTWDELIEYATALTTDEVYGLMIPTDDGSVGWMTWGLQYGTGGLPISEDWSTSAILTEGYADLLGMFKELYDNELVPPQVFYSPVTPDALCEGRIAMQMIGSYAIGTLATNYADMTDKIGVSFFPTKDGSYEQPTATMGGWSYCIDANSKHPEEAAEVIQWILAGDPQIMVEYAKVSNFSKYSTRKSVDEALNNDPEAQASEWRAIFSSKVVPYAQSEPTYNFAVTSAFGAAVNRMLLMDMSVEETLAQADEEIQSIIDNYGLAGTNPKLK